MKRFFVIFAAGLLLLLSACGERAAAPEEPVLTPCPVADMPATPTPAPTPEPVTFDPLKTPADLLGQLQNEDLQNEWEKLMAALETGTERFAADSTDAAGALLPLVENSPYKAFFTLATANELVTVDHADGVDFSYFSASVTAVLQECCSADETDIVKAIHLYRAAATLRYSETDSPDLYTAAVKGLADDCAFAAYLQLLFTQADIPAYIAHGEDGHFWVIAELSGDLYHFDPVYENGATAGLGLSFFGMSDTAHAALGGGGTYRLILNGAETESQDLCPATRFDESLNGATDWAYADGQLTVTYGFDPAAVMTRLPEDLTR